MQFKKTVTVQEIAELIGAVVEGNPNDVVKGINEIHKVEKGDLAFVDHPKYYEKCLKSDASFIIINNKVENTFGKTLLICTQPFEAYLTIVRHYNPFRPQQEMISESAVIGEGTVLMPNVFIGANVHIGSNCIIHPNVVIHAGSQIGNGVVIHSGAVIGADAFYYNTKKDRAAWYKKMESCGNVVLEDEVEIGANSCIDRGVTHTTRIGRGSKLDNLVQVGHDVVIGNNCIIAAQVGIAGATTIGNGVTLWGQVGVSKTLSIGDNTQVLAQSGVPSSLEGGKVYFGYPAEEAGTKRREIVWIKRIPEMWEKLRQMQSH
ncbi:MAG: UDP-3-O-(3-hydroxymyristoyl)glucosamine N-acyltransferase [Chitinophagaceae bacterium]|nr:UDP-3-O-(3-hydroxymyristoyl)glucosamine N-acyltransferase [Chitinophagaceae bacterium]